MKGDKTDPDNSPLISLSINNMGTSTFPPVIFQTRTNYLPSLFWPEYFPSRLPPKVAHKDKGPKNLILFRTIWEDILLHSNDE